MKIFAHKLALATAVALAAVLAAEAAYAQRNRAPSKRYETQQPWSGGGSRFTPEEQRIIDQITANDWRNGR